MSSNTDIYSLYDYITQIQSKTMGLENQDILCLGLFGYNSEMFANIWQNAAIMASEYSNEAIPTRANYAKNVITHALSLGIKSLNATPATMEVAICIPEDILVDNMYKDKFTLDKDFKIMIGEYEFHIDYDIIIKKTVLSTGEYVYTALYDMTGEKNPLSEISNPYLPPVGKILMTSTNLIVITCKIRQVEYTQIYKKILTSNTLENKVFSFQFENQLANFTITAVEGNDTYSLKPVYDGLYEYNKGYFCNYLFLDEDDIRVTFNRESYQPNSNCDVYIGLYTTHGTSSNFEYKDDVILDLTSTRFSYDGMYMIIRPITNSTGGVDKKSVDELKKIIPKEALSRGSITTSTDLNNYFNQINNQYVRLYFLENINNNLERVYYSYLLMKIDNNVVPTNSIKVSILRRQFDSATNENLVLNPGNVIYYHRDSGVVLTNPTEEEIKDYEDKGFVYFNPFMNIINKSPFYVSYFVNIIHDYRLLNFEWINDESRVQFISDQVVVDRAYFTDRNMYKVEIALMQNINGDFGLVELDNDGNIIELNVRVFGILKNVEGKPHRWIEAELKEYDDGAKVFNFVFKMTTDDAMDNQNNIRLLNVKDFKFEYDSYGYFPDNTGMDIYVCVKEARGISGGYDIDTYISNLDGWAVTNKYSVSNGIPLLINYSNMISSFVKVTKNSDSMLQYTINKLPVIRRSYITTEERLREILEQLDQIRSYIEYSLAYLEDSFGIDFKLFNTFGPARLFRITDTQTIDRTCLTLTFKVKFNSVSDRYLKDYIIQDIKAYIEDMETLSDFHVPNLITHITNKYRDQIVYFEYVDMNGYGPGFQHVYRDAFESHITEVPEFLNINTIDEDYTPDINIIVV